MLRCVEKLVAACSAALVRRCSAPRGRALRERVSELCRLDREARFVDNLFHETIGEERRLAGDRQEHEDSEKAHSVCPRVAGALSRASAPAAPQALRACVSSIARCKAIGKNSGPTADPWIFSMTASTRPQRQASSVPIPGDVLLFSVRLQARLKPTHGSRGSMHRYQLPIQLTKNRVQGQPPLPDLSGRRAIKPPAPIDLNASIGRSSHPSSGPKQQRSRRPSRDVQSRGQKYMAFCPLLVFFRERRRRAARLQRYAAAEH